MRRITEDRGTGLVEFAIMAPPLSSLLFGVIEFGLAFQEEMT